MFSCHLCGGTAAKEELVNEIFQLDGQPVLMEHIPAQACTRCGELTFSRETTELIRRMVHGEARPVHSISIQVFDFARNSQLWQPTALPLPV